MTRTPSLKLFPFCHSKRNPDIPGPPSESRVPCCVCQERGTQWWGIRPLHKGLLFSGFWKWKMLGKCKVHKGTISETEKQPLELSTLLRLQKLHVEKKIKVIINDKTKCNIYFYLNYTNWPQNITQSKPEIINIIWFNCKLQFGIKNTTLLGNQNLLFFKLTFTFRIWCCYLKLEKLVLL